MSIDLGLTVTFVNNASNGLRGLAGDVKRVGDNAQATSNRLKAIQVVIGGILLQKTIQWGKSLLEVASANQTLDMRMARFAGGANAAAAIQKRLNDTFAGSGLVVDDLAEDFIKLNSTVRDTARSETIINGITNAVLSMGGGQQVIDNVTTAFQRMAGTGTASQRELKSLIVGTGISLQEMATAAGMGFTQFDQEMRKGLMDADTFIDAFVKASGQKFGDFAKMMSFTIGGAMSRVANVWDQAISDIGGKTDLFERIAIVFNHIADAVQEWAASIDQADIDTFFGILADFEPIARVVAKTLFDVGKMIIFVADMGAKALALLPAEALEYGLIGYFVFGKKGAVILGSLGFIGTKFGELVAQMLVAAGVGREALAMINSMQGMVGGNLAGSSFAGDTQAMKDAMAALTKPNGGVGGSGISDATNEAMERQAAYLADLLRGAEDVRAKLGQWTTELGGDKFAVQIASIAQETENWRASLDKLVEKNNTLPIAYQLTVDQLGIITDFTKPGGLIDQGLAKQVERIEKIKKLTLERQEIEHTMALWRIGQEQFDLKQGMFGSGLSQLGQGTSAGQTSLEVGQKKVDLNFRILEISKEQKEIEEQIVAAGSDQKRIEQLKELSATYGTLQDTARQALADLSVQGEFSKELWRSVGSTIENGIGSALANVVTGTGTLADAANAAFNSITEAAARYIAKLIIIQGLNAISPGAGTALGGLFGSAKGNVFSGGIKPFANGDIIRGPTMFGLAGEAGDEAIMPLTRIGGKLGVRAEGGGGGQNITINVTAIDTQSGMEFIGQHAADIGAALGHRTLLNRRGK